MLESSPNCGSAALLPMLNNAAPHSLRPVLARFSSPFRSRIPNVHCSRRCSHAPPFVRPRKDTRTAPFYGTAQPIVRMRFNIIIFVRSPVCELCFGCRSRLSVRSPRSRMMPLSRRLRRWIRGRSDQQKNCSIASRVAGFNRLHWPRTYTKQSAHWRLLSRCIRSTEIIT